MTREVTQDAFVGERPSAYAATPWRVVTLLDKLQRDGAIDGGMHQAGRILDDLHAAFKAEHSEGVTNLTGGGRASSPWRKADRKGQRLTGYEVKPNGKVSYDPRHKKTNRSATRDFADAMWAMCGVHDLQGNKVFDNKAFGIMLRVVAERESPPNLKQLSQEISNYYGEKSKQAPPSAMGYIWAHLGRLAAHLNAIKWEEWHEP